MTNDGLMSRNPEAHVLAAHHDSCTDTQRTSPSRQTHETDTPDTVTIEMPFGENRPFDHKKSFIITSEDRVPENCPHVARRSDGTTGTAGMRTSCERGIHSC